MSTGETPPTPRFTSPSNTSSNPPKKYPGTPKSPLTTNSTTVGNNRNLLVRQRLLSGKVSAPRPMNLPSLRKEQTVGTEVLSSSPSTTSHGWGSSASNSPSNSFTQPSELESKVNSIEQSTTSPTIDPAENSNGINFKSNKNSTSKADPASSPPPQPPTTTRAWAIPVKVQPAVQTPSTDFPTAAEAASKKKSSVYDDKEYLKYASSDPNHTSWDEMVSEDLDEFSVDVVEFDDGTKVQIEGNDEAVNPSDRFNEDYDRSYPPKTTYHNTDPIDHNTHHHASNYKPNYRRSEDQGYNNPRYNNSVHAYENRRHSSTTSNDRWNNHHRRESADSNTNRRSSYDKKSSGSLSSHHNNSTTPYHPTLLQRPRRLSEQSFRSDHSREDVFHLEHHTNPLQIIPEPSTSSTIVPVAEEITAAQREVMLTAAERAKKRRDEEEAEFEAARIRARQKADALAEKARLDAEKKEKESAKEVKAESTKEVKTESIKEEKNESSSSAKSAEKKTNNSDISTVKPILKKKDSNPTSEPAVQPTTPRSSSTIIDTSKPWNLVAANKKITIEKRPKPETTSEKDKEIEKTKEAEKEKEISEPPKEIEPPKFDKDGKPLTEDEQNWEVYVSKIKSDSAKPASRAEVTSNDWNSFATRLQKSQVDKQKVHEAKHKATLSEKQKETVVEEIHYNEIEESNISHHNNNGKVQNRGWTRGDSEHSGHSRNERDVRGRGTGDRPTRGARTTQGVNRRQAEASNWRQSNDINEHEKEHVPVPVITEILKHEPAINPTTIISKKTRLTNLLKKSNSPIFPDVIQKLVGKKPANISFMIDVDESDKDITMMDVVVEVINEDKPIVPESKTVQSKSDVEEVPNKFYTVEEPITSEPVEEPSASESLEVPSASESVEVTEAVDETSATSSTASTPPRTQFQQQHGHNKLDSSSPQRLNVNPNFPLLVYQYPVPQQQQQDQHTPTSGYSNGYSSRPKGYHQQQHQQRPMGVYLMPPQQYISGNQYIVPYTQAGAGVQPMYYPAMPWQSQYNNNNGSNSSPRPHFEQRRPNNSVPNTNTPNHTSKWEAHSNNVAYQSHRPTYHSNYRGGYRKRGGWNSRGRGGYNHSHQSTARRYPDVNTVSPQEQHSQTETNNNL